ncbi:MAG: SMP-30/gluconolactonase/LRE family protein [Ahrensia sp.]|nr:SMP-30/gluconolactonase/LRE family protein [Ahrensia sp.]
MKLEVRDPALLEAIPQDAQLEQLETDFSFVEGPIWHPSEHWLMFSDIPESVQYLWREEEGLAVFRTPSNMSNGNCFDRQGRIISCEHGTSSVIRHENDGKVCTPIATHHQGLALNSPNDVVVDSAGRIYFTDPVFGRQDHPMKVGYPRAFELDVSGVYRLDPDGSLHLLADDFQQPNGLCLSVDETRLFVSDTPGFHIRVFDRADDGSVSGGAVWAPVEGDHIDDQGKKWVPDGLKTSLGGHILSSGPGGIHIFSPEGACLGVMLMPEKSANFCFGGADRDWLYVTASTSLYRVKTNMQGPPAFLSKSAGL